MATELASAGTGAAAGAGIGSAVAPGVGTIIGAAIGGVAGLGSSFISNYLSGKSNSKTNETNMKIAQMNMLQQQERFNYQKYLNNNQIQINAADAQKAGINPLAMQGASLQSGSYNNIDANQQAMTYDTSEFSNAAIAAGNMINERSIANGNNKTSKDIAEGNNTTTKEVADIQARSNEQMNREKLESDERIKEQEMLLEAEKINSENNSDYENRYEQFIKNRFEARERSVSLYRTLRSNLNDASVRAKLQVAINKEKETNDSNTTTNDRSAWAKDWKRALGNLSRGVLANILGISGEVEAQIEARASELGITFGDYISGCAVNNNSEDFEQWFNKMYQSKAPTKRSEIKVKNRKEW